jgi:hypothetical protein
MLRKIRKRWRVVTQSKGGSLECVVTENGQHNPLTWREPAKTSKLLFAGTAATHPKKLRKFLFSTKIFCIQISENYMNVLTYLRVLATKI